MPTPKGVSMEMQMDATHQACPWGVFLIFTIWVPFVVPFGILNLSNDTCEMNLTLWMQLEICVLFALPALIFLVLVCIACFKCRCLFECIHGTGELIATAVATLQLACLIWGSVILFSSKISKAACVMHPEDNVNPYVLHVNPYELLKVMVYMQWDTIFFLVVIHLLAAGRQTPT